MRRRHDLRAGSPQCAEGKGWLLGYLSHMDADCGELIILDATRPQADPLARIRLPQRMPLGSHGCWLARDQLR